MKNILKAMILFTAVILIGSCEKDEGKLPNISFKTGGSYISADTSLAGGSTITIGIDASKSENKDVLKKFNISRTVDAAAATSVFDKYLSGSEGDNFSYDYSATLDTIVGQTNKYTFTVTNRDGLVNQVSLTVTVR